MEQYEIMAGMTKPELAKLALELATKCTFLDQKLEDDLGNMLKAVQELMKNA